MRKWSTKRFEGIRLGAELAEVVVEMLVRQDRPLLRGEGAEEGVGVGGAVCWAGCGEAVD